MRVAWLGAVSPLPLTDGNRHRHFHLVREVSRGHDVTLICPATALEREAVQSRLPDIKVVTVPAPHRSASRLSGALRQQPTCLVPSVIGAMIDVAGHEDIGEFHVAFGALSVAPAVASVSAKRKVLDEQNVEAELYERLWRQQPMGVRKLARFHDWRLVKSYERRWTNWADAVTACSTRDVTLLQRVAPKQRFYVIANGVDVDRVQFSFAHRPEPAVLLVGGMSWAPNVEAVRILVEEVMPLVWERRPDVQVWLVGKDPVREVACLASERVTVTGEVASVDPYLRRAALTVIPLRAGGGTRLKILEAMAAGLPVITTPVGAEGLDVRHPDELWIAEEVNDLAAAVVLLLQDRHRAASMAAAARRRAESYNWRAIGAQLAMTLTNVGSQPAAPAAET